MVNHVAGARPEIEVTARDFSVQALGLTGYVLIAMRYEERDLARAFGVRYNRWRGAVQ